MTRPVESLNLPGCHRSLIENRQTEAVENRCGKETELASSAEAAGARAGDERGTDMCNASDDPKRAYSNSPFSIRRIW